jgi:hypothetical protein
MSLRQFNDLNLSNEDQKNYKIIIAGLDGGPVTGAIEADFGFAGGNDFSTAGEALKDLPIAGNLIDLKNKITNLATISGRSATTELETRKVWNNSLIPDIPLQFTLYQANANDESIIDKVKRIKSAVYPTRAGAFFKAPLGYRFVGQNSRQARGTLTVQIGTWFRAFNLVMTSENVTFSKEVNVNGSPIRANVSVTLQPFRAITYEEMQSWFLV